MGVSMLYKFVCLVWSVFVAHNPSLSSLRNDMCSGFSVNHSCSYLLFLGLERGIISNVYKTHIHIRS